AVLVLRRRAAAGALPLAVLAAALARRRAPPARARGRRAPLLRVLGGREPAADLRHHEQAGAVHAAGVSRAGAAGRACAGRLPRRRTPLRGALPRLRGALARPDDAARAARRAGYRGLGAAARLAVDRRAALRGRRLAGDGLARADVARGA